MSLPQNRTQRLEDTASSAPTASHPLLEPLASRYEFVEGIGDGGMGTVYRARDRETGETLAIKVLRPEIADEPAMIERFKNELRLARRITHKNVCRIYEFNRVGPTAYITMEYVEGETLRAHMRRNGRLAPAHVLDLALQICAGLGEAHAQGIMHRDLKPENVMLARDGTVKLMDFGIARAIGGDSVTTQTLIGTPAYMAPEQAHGRIADHRADIYALGLIMYECLTGRRAFSGATPVAVAVKQLQERPPSPRKLAPTIPRPLETVVLRCLEKEPKRRFASVAEVRSALEGSLTVRRRRRGRLVWIGLLALIIAVGAAALAKLGKRIKATQNSAVLPITALPTKAAPAPERNAGADGPSRETQRVPERARRLFEAAKGGDPAAQERLGQMFLTGPERVRNERKAAYWFHRAALGGQRDAQRQLGQMYERGRGVERDVVEAYAWYALAATAGSDAARADVERLGRQLTATQRGEAERRAGRMTQRRGSS